MKAVHGGLAGAVLAVALVLCAPVRAQTLEQAWRLAAAHDRALAAAADDVQAARSSARAARAGRWPSIRSQASYTRFGQTPELDVVTPASALRSGPIFKNDQYVSASVQVRLPLYTGGAIRNDIDAARAGLKGASATERAVSADVKLEVAEAYVAVLRAQRELGVTRESVTSLAAQVRDVQAKYERQAVAKSDLLAARVALANAREQQVAADNALAIARASYERLLGAPLDRVPHLDPRLPVFAVDSLPLAALLARALHSRQELQALGARAAVLAARARVADASRLPHIAAIGGYTHFDNQILNHENFSMVGLGFTWKLFDGGAAASEADALRARSRAERQRLADLRSRIELAVRAAWLQLAAARAQIEASRAATAQAAENLRISRELYRVGLASNTQVLEAVTLRAEAARNYDDARLDAGLDRLRLAYAVGAL